MADPPPEDPSDQHHAVSFPPQPLSFESLDPISPSREMVPPPANLSGLPHVAAESFRPPLAELSLNGEYQSETKATATRPSSPRPSMVAPLRLIKKRKSVAKSHSYQHLSYDEVIHRKMKEADFEVPRAGLAAIVQPLQTVEAMDEPLDEREDDEYSDEEEDFDIEAYQCDEMKRAELVKLMEKYDVYDEEQLRLAVRREKKQGKNVECLAVAPMQSSESAPSSPSGNLSRFIPPSHANMQLRLEDPNPYNSSTLDGKSVSPSNLDHTFHNHQPPSHITAHNDRELHGKFDFPITNPSHPSSPHVTPMQVPMQSLVNPASLDGKEAPPAHNPNPIPHIISTHNSNPSPNAQPDSLMGPVLTQPNSHNLTSDRGVGPSPSPTPPPPSRPDTPMSPTHTPTTPPMQLDAAHDDVNQHSMTLSNNPVGAQALVPNLTEFPPPPQREQAAWGDIAWEGDGQRCCDVKLPRRCPRSKSWAPPP